MKFLIGLLFFVCSCSISYAAKPNACPISSAIINMVNNLKADPVYTAGYYVHETDFFNTPQLWWLNAVVDFSDIKNSAAALQLVKEAFNTIQLQSPDPVMNANNSWWFCFYTEMTASGALTIYVATEV